MKISPELIVGNIWLRMIEENESKTEFSQEEFLDYSSKIEERVTVSNRDLYVSTTLTDILDTASCFRHYVEFIRMPGDENPSVLRLKDGGRDILKRKLEIYFKSITPAWLLSEIEQALGATTQISTNVEEN